MAVSKAETIIRVNPVSKSKIKIGKILYRLMDITKERLMSLKINK